MIILKIVLIAIYGLCAIGTMYLIGEERKPLTANGALIGIIIYVVTIVALIN